MSVIRIPIRHVTAQAYWKYKLTRELGVGAEPDKKRMPPTVALFEPEAADAFMEMQEACEFRMQFTDMYRSVLFQAKARVRARGTKKHRLLAPPTKSGHNFAWSFDLAVRETLMSMRKSDRVEIIQAGQSRKALGDWMRQFGWTGIRSESWHFNFLGNFPTTVAKVDAKYGDAFRLSNRDVQRCLNQLLKFDGKDELVVDGILGKKSTAAAIKSMTVLDVTRDHATGFSAWFRRVLAGATAVLVDVDS